MNETEDSNRAATDLEPVGAVAERVVERLRDRAASRAKAAVVAAAQRRRLPRWLATLIVSRTGLRGA